MSAKLRRSSSSESTAARSGTDAYLSPLPPPHRDAHAGNVDHGGQYEAHKPGPVVERPEQAGSGRAAQCGDEARQVGQDAGDERENRDPVEAAREFVDAVPLVEIVEHELTAPYDEVVRDHDSGDGTQQRAIADQPGEDVGRGVVVEPPGHHHNSDHGGDHCALLERDLVGSEVREAVRRGDDVGRDVGRQRRDRQPHHRQNDHERSADPRQQCDGVAMRWWKMITVAFVTAAPMNANSAMVPGRPTACPTIWSRCERAKREKSGIDSAIVPQNATADVSPTPNAPAMPRPFASVCPPVCCSIGRKPPTLTIAQTSSAAPTTSRNGDPQVSRNLIESIPRSTIHTFSAQNTMKQRNSPLFKPTKAGRTCGSVA